mmetsp:Transcript_16788/g.34182  ORF Transcript_16788/g.34182 Transcript_16788/m.34182 type:complete len:81 (+) Transcript_16788:318-560(+)
MIAPLFQNVPQCQQSRLNFPENNEFLPCQVVSQILLKAFPHSLVIYDKKKNRPKCNDRIGKEPHHFGFLTSRKTFSASSI